MLYWLVLNYLKFSLVLLLWNLVTVLYEENNSNYVDVTGKSVCQIVLSISLESSADWCMFQANRCRLHLATFVRSFTRSAALGHEYLFYDFNYYRQYFQKVKLSVATLSLPTCAWYRFFGFTLWLLKRSLRKKGRSFLFLHSWNYQLSHALSYFDIVHLYIYD